MSLTLPGDVRVDPPVVPTVRVEPPGAATVVTVPVAGPEGPQGERGPEGPEGPPGGTSYVHTQSSPSASWVINHNLGRRVHVSLLSPTERVVHADIEHGSLNQTSVTFPSPTSGTAVLS